MCFGFIPAFIGSKNINDVVFIAIDFEYLENVKQDPSQNLDTQVGVAILDTQNFVSSPRNAICTFNFVIGSPSYCAKNTRKFLFGKTVTIHRKDISQKLEALISRTRNNILVGQDFINDLRILQFLQFNLYSSIVGILDLQKVAAEIMPGVPLKLYNILEELSCPYGGLHNAGNDAYFTLRALLLLAIKSYPSSIAANNDHQSKLTALEAVTQVPIPARRNRHDKNREKKLKRMQKSKKYQARLRDIETVERIRAERVERKIEKENDLKFGSWLSTTTPNKAAEIEDGVQLFVGLERLVNKLARFKWLVIVLMEEDAFCGPSTDKNTEARVVSQSTVAKAENTIIKNNRRKELRFKALHLLLIAFFLWLLSECQSPPFDINRQNPGSADAGCWFPKTFDKAVILIIDALRYDFTIPVNSEVHHFHNALKVLHDTAQQYPENAFLLPFIADPPTTTLLRLKGLTTGTLPTFIDAGSNFAGTAIEEDNLVAQLRSVGKMLVHLGDDTWHQLFPDYFEPNLTHAYDSFNVWDLHTVDNGVTGHLLPLLEPQNAGKWDVIFGHFLGVDHAGHRYGPDHQATNEKLKQMDNVIRQVMTSLDDETLLVVMGDHGMDTKGDHGGESDDEVESALWMYSKKPVFGHGHNGIMEPPSTARDRPVGQIDLVPTLALLLGMPIPFNSLGSPIAEAFITPKQPDWQRLASVNALAAAQIQRYQREYSKARGLDNNVFADSLERWEVAQDLWRSALQLKKESRSYKSVYTTFSDYQRETLQICRSLWARFDILSMIYGIILQTGSLLVILIYARASTPYRVEDVPVLLRHILITTPFCVILALGLGVAFPSIGMLNSGLLGFAAGGLLGFASALRKVPYGYSIPLPNSFWGWISIVFTLLQAIGFASNSYTIWEDEILMFLLSTFACLVISATIRQSSSTDRVLGLIQASIFFVLTRVASLSRLCREEQMPYCKSTYYSSATSSTSASWQLLIPFASSMVLPSLIKSYFRGTRSYEGSAVIWIGVVLRLGLLACGVFWSLDAADDNDWLSVNKDILRTLKTTIAQLILGTAFVAGTTYYVLAKPCISIEVLPTTDESDAGNITPYKPKSVTVFGYSNMHGSRYFLIVGNWLLAIVLLQKPMGGGTIVILALQLFALLEVIDSNDLSQSAIGPVVLALLGSFYFFKTGHQATLASIQWESAFIPLKAIHYPWSPMLVFLNTYGAQIFTTIAVPLLVLWKKPPQKKGLLGDVAMAMATYILYFAVINLATTMWAGWLRRHLMLYRIFSPRYLTGMAMLLVVDIVGIVVALGSVRWNFLSVSEVFGWA
ncbi:MAG: hypothetical protein Q9167_005800 [Letrouitia subvulpina]